MKFLYKQKSLSLQGFAAGIHLSTHLDTATNLDQYFPISCTF